MPDDDKLFLDQGGVSEQAAAIEAHIQQSQAAHLGQCQALENSIHDAFSSMPFLRDPALQYVNLMRQRFQSLFDFYDESFLKDLRKFASDLTQTSGAMGQTWASDAAQQYQERQQQWTQAQTNLGSVLDTIGETTKNTHDAYNNTEKHNSSGWSN